MLKRVKCTPGALVVSLKSSPCVMVPIEVRQSKNPLNGLHPKQVVFISVGAKKQNQRLCVMDHTQIFRSKKTFDPPKKVLEKNS